MTLVISRRSHELTSFLSLAQSSAKKKKLDKATPFTYFPRICHYIYIRSFTRTCNTRCYFAASDLDCIKALFNEKEKELSLAVAKVEELTRQLEELRGRHPGPGHLVTPASAELEKLRRELLVSLLYISLFLLNVGG